MIALKVSATLVFVVFAFYSCNTREPDVREGIVISESRSYEASIYRQNCAICHGLEAYGKRVDGKLVPSLRSGEAAGKTEAEIYRQIAYGKLPMPSFRRQLTGSEIRRLARFIKREVQGRREKVKGKR